MAQVLPRFFKREETLRHRSTIVKLNYFDSRAYINTGSVLNYSVKIYGLGRYTRQFKFDSNSITLELLVRCELKFKFDSSLICKAEPNPIKIWAFHLDCYCNSIEIGRSNKVTKSFRLCNHSIASFIKNSKLILPAVPSYLGTAILEVRKMNEPKFYTFIVSTSYLLAERTRD